jgi:riboflavin kinase/FMN adenylyltransferase
MRIYRGLESYPPEAPPAAVALGAFDGIHLGHRAILGQAVSCARRGGLTSLVCTFEPHPLEVLQPGRAPVPITTPEERLRLIAEVGIEATLIVVFTKAMASVEPETFVEEVLVGRLRAREIVVGFNHRFGRGARGDGALLESLGKAHGYRAHIVPPVTIGGMPVSSTEIRGALQRGDVATASALLGRPYAIGGRVVQGAGRGRVLGFPTANVSPDRPLLVPSGVYACRAELDGTTAHPAVVNIGVRPTFGETVLAVEAHLLDFSGNLYDRHLRLAFVARLRDERRFPGPDALRTQIAADVAAARAAL